MKFSGDPVGESSSSGEDEGAIGGAATGQDYPSHGSGHHKEDCVESGECVCHCNPRALGMWQATANRRLKRHDSNQEDL